jgi:hypothetical protein
MNLRFKTPMALAALGILAGPLVEAQTTTKIDLKTQARDVDFSQASSTRPARTGTSLPATCAAGELFYKTNASAGENLFGCTATNIWTELGGTANVILVPRISLSNGVLSVGANCAGSPCFVRFGSSVYQFSSTATASQLTGTGTSSTIYVYIRSNGSRYIGINGIGVASATVSNMNVESGIVGFPGDVFPLGTCQASGGAFVSCSEYLVGGRDILTPADSTIIITSNTGTGRQSVSVNPAAFVTTAGNNNLPGLNQINYTSLSLKLLNDSSTGTMANRVVMLTNGSVKTAPAGTENGILGICNGNCGTAGFARIITRGTATCAFDGATTGGDFVVLSRQLDGYCTSAGAVRPLTGPVLGVVPTTNASTGNYDILLEPGGAPVASNSISSPLHGDATYPPTRDHAAQLTTTGTARLAALNATTRILGICRGGCSASGWADIVIRGTVQCAFDGPATAGHYVQLSTTTAGACNDAGVSPGSGVMLGYVLVGVPSAGAGTILLDPTNVH